MSCTPLKHLLGMNQNRRQGFIRVLAEEIFRELHRSTVIYIDRCSSGGLFEQPRQTFPWMIMLYVVVSLNMTCFTPRAGQDCNGKWSHQTWVAGKPAFTCGVMLHTPQWLYANVQLVMCRKYVNNGCCIAAEPDIYPGLYSSSSPVLPIIIIMSFRIIILIKYLM